MALVGVSAGVGSCGSVGEVAANGGMDAAIDSSVDAALADERSVCGPPDGAVDAWTRVLGALNAGSAVWGNGECDVWIASGLGATTPGELAHWDGFSLSKVAQPWPASRSLFGLSAHDAWAVGGARIEHWDGQSWSELMPDAGFLPVTGGWGTPVQAWFTGSGLPRDRSDGRCNSGLLAAWDGQMWTEFPIVRSCGQAMWGTSQANVWAVGWARSNLTPLKATCDHWDGQKWHLAGSGDPGTASFDQHAPFVAVHGSSSTNAWAVGIADSQIGGAVARWDGQSWSLVPSPVYLGPCGQSGNGGGVCDLSGVWVAGPDEAWAVGGSGVFRWDGTTWAIHTKTIAPLRAVWGASPTSVWAVGDGAILHYAGTPN